MPLPEKQGQCIPSPGYVGTRQETYKSEHRPRDESEPSSSPQAVLALSIIAAGAFGDSGIW